MAREVEQTPIPKLPSITDAETKLEFVQCLRTLLDNAGASYRDIERMGRKAGLVIAATTVHNLVTGKTAPTRRVLINFLHACGLDAEEHQEWLRKRDELYRRPHSSGGISRSETASSPGRTRRSRYFQQVRDIAPIDGARDREPELSELADFCSGDEPYIWWQAPPWAGKSALMSTFVLDPPPNVLVVSFFITGRLAAQATSAAFTDAVLEQLTALTGEDLPPSLAPGQRDVYRRALLEKAADLVGRQGQRLVLVVDGLDEDQGGGPASGIASIASLLPKQPPEGLRIVLAGRPAPEIPKDVARDHPIRTCRRRLLTPSPYAGEIADLAQRELDELLAGSAEQRDLVGLITASGGGLTLVEIQELTGFATYLIESMLNGVCGRTVAGRADYSLINHRRLFLFTHETLLQQAEQRLGTLVEKYRERIHIWAGDYRDRVWPAGTPPYLLHGYFQMLSDRRDLVRMLECATDPGRHDRMLDLTGGDAAALVEIRTLQSLLIGQDSPDLAALARLCVRRGALIERNANIPVALPTVWAMIGHVTRADALILAIADEYQRARALIVMAGAMVTAGSDQQFSVLAAHAEEAAQTITDPGLRSWVLAELARASADAGQVRTAASLITKAQEGACMITDPERRAWELIVLARLASVIGDQQRAAALASAGEEAARAIVSPSLRASVLEEVERTSALAPGGNPSTTAAPTLTTDTRTGATTAMEIDAETLDPEEWAELLTDQARAAADAGDYTRAVDLSTQAEVIARTIVHPDRHVISLAVLAMSMSHVGDFDRAESIVRAMPDVEQRVAASGELIAMAGDALGAEKAGQIAVGIADPDRLAWALLGLAQTSNRDANHGRVKMLTTAAEHLVPTISDPGGQASVLVALAGMATEIRDFGWAESIARKILDPRHQKRALVRLGLAAAVGGDYQRIVALGLDPDGIVGSVDDVSQQVQQLIDVAKALAAVGEREQAGVFIAKAEEMLSAFPVERTLIGLAEAYGRIGRFDRAEEVVESVADLYEQTQAALALAQLLGRAGQGERAAELIVTVVPAHQRAQAYALLAQAVCGIGDVDRAESIARAIRDGDHRDRALAALVLIVREDGDVDRAESIACAISNEEQRDMTLADLVEVVIGTGDLSRAQALAQAIVDPYRLTWALVDLAKISVETEDQQRTMDMAAAAKAAALMITDRVQQSQALAELVRIAVSADNIKLAALTAREISDRTEMDIALAEVAAAMRRTGDLSGAERIIQAIADPAEQVRTLVDLTTAAVAQGDRARAVRLSETIIAAGRELVSVDQRAQALTALLEAIATTKADACVASLTAQAKDLAELLSDEEDDLRDDPGVLDDPEVLFDLAAAVSRAGDPDGGDAIYRRAEELTLRDAEPVGQTSALMNLTRRAVETGDDQQALVLLLRAHQTALTIPDPDQQAEAMTYLAQEAVDAGYSEQAESIVRQIADPGWQAEALTSLVCMVEPEQARRLLGLALTVDDWQTSVHHIAERSREAIDGLVAQIQLEMHALGSDQPIPAARTPLGQ